MSITKNFLKEEQMLLLKHCKCKELMQVDLLPLDMVKLNLLIQMIQQKEEQKIEELQV